MHARTLMRQCNKKFIGHLITLRVGNARTLEVVDAFTPSLVSFFHGGPLYVVHTTIHLLGSSSWWLEVSSKVSTESDDTDAVKIHGNVSSGMLTLLPSR